MDKKHRFTLHVNMDDFIPATDEEKSYIVQMRPSTTFFKDGVKRLCRNKVALVSLIVVAIIAVLIAIAIPTFTASLNKAKVATDEANIRAGYASAMAELIAGDTDVADGATLYLQKDGSVAATGTNDYTCQGKPGAAVEIAGQSVAAWDKGHKVVYTFDAAANHFAISTAE